MAVSKKGKRSNALHNKANNMSSANDDSGDKDGDGSANADFEGVGARNKCVSY